MFPAQERWEGTATVILYATKDGEVAYDGDGEGRLGVFAAAKLEVLKAALEQGGTGKGYTINDFEEAMNTTVPSIAKTRGLSQSPDRESRGDLSFELLPKRSEFSNPAAGDDGRDSLRSSQQNTLPDVRLPMDWPVSPADLETIPSPKRKGDCVNSLDGKLMRRIEPGVYTVPVGSPGESRSGLQRIELRSAFYIASEPVTVEEWKKSGRHHPDPPRGEPRSKFAHASWDDACDYVRRMGASLPTAQQWEIAALGVVGTTSSRSITRKSQPKVFSSWCGATFYPVPHPEWVNDVSQSTVNPEFLGSQREENILVPAIREMKNEMVMGVSVDRNRVKDWGAIPFRYIRTAP